MPTKTAAELIQDDVIEQDIQLARVDAGLQRRIDARLDQLGKDLAALAIDIDVNGTQRRDARWRRMLKLNKESRELIRVAYSDIAALTRKTLVNVADAVSTNMATSLEASIP